MGISPWKVGQTLPVWKVTLSDDSGAALDLTGATVTLKAAYAMVKPLTYSAALGQLVVTNAATGVIQYAVSSSDIFVLTAGDYLLEWTATYPSGEVVTDSLALTTDPS